MRQKQQLVRIWARPNRNGNDHTLYLRYTDLNGKRRCESLGHSDRRKADKQRGKKEKELRMEYCEPESMKLKDFAEDSLIRTGDQIRESTHEQYDDAVKDFISVVGNIDFQKITLDHGEYYRQTCIDKGNSKATVAKKLRHLKRLFGLAVQRKQLDENPLRYIDMPKVSKKKNIRIYSQDECRRMLREAKQLVAENNLDTTLSWDLLILTALESGMRRGELLNLSWGDIDFENQEIDITPKDNTDYTWEWLIKDTDERTVPLSQVTTQLLIVLQEKRPVGYPYVFVPIKRYDYIQKLRKGGKWSYSDSRLKVVNNFYRQFGAIKKRAGIKKKGTFHDLRRTALSNWFHQGCSEYDVMTLAGHSSFQTTHEFYLAIKKDYLDRARQASNLGLGEVLVQEDNLKEKLF